ncbi:MAG: AraC-like DNA-binding protein [Cyclobacteriaceae bacterium]|jgi:AraC-like DNA-binding protein
MFILLVVLVINNTIYLLIRTKYKIMDVLSDILKKIKLSSAVYFKSNFHSPWGMKIDRGAFAQFHIVTRGQCLLKTNNKRLTLFAGDIVVFPMGASHSLADHDLSEIKNGQDVVQAIVNGNSLFDGDVVSTTLVCGHFEFDRSITHPLIQELPEIIHITDSERKELPWLEGITNLIIQEADSEKNGSKIIVNKLGEILFIHTLRAFIQNMQTKKGFLAAIQDKRICKALRVIHNRSNEEWQLVTLAKVAGMSRTNFSNQFKVLTNQTPLTYMTNWRMLQAKELLKETKNSVGGIAGKVGYQSEAAFNRVFKKNTTQTPLKYRQSVHVS